MTAGALAAGVVLQARPANPVYAVLAVVVLAAASATAGSRWYVTSAFTTFLVFLMLLYDHPEQATQKVVERVGETLRGVALAIVFVWLLPALAQRRGRRRQHEQ